jgi:hypothetical protein
MLNVTSDQTANESEPLAIQLGTTLFQCSALSIHSRHRGARTDPLTENSISIRSLAACRH